jgi:Fe-S oxidoreductase
MNCLKNEYGDFGGKYEVVHGSQLVADLIAAGRIQLDTPIPETITFHDPCYLGRYNGVYDAPRRILDSIPGLRRSELSRSREKGLCCGAGGGRMWMEEKIGTRVNHNRTDEVIASGADTVATACPFCTIMLRDGVQDRGAGEKVQVLNVSELVAKSMKRKRELESSPSPPGKQ